MSCQMQTLCHMLCLSKEPDAPVKFACSASRFPEGNAGHNSSHHSKNNNHNDCHTHPCGTRQRKVSMLQGTTVASCTIPAVSPADVHTTSSSPSVSTFNGRSVNLAQHMIAHVHEHAFELPTISQPCASAPFEVMRGLSKGEVMASTVYLASHSP